MHPFIETQKEWLKDLPPFRAGDTLKVNVRVREGDKERLQAFEGVCLARRGSGVSAAGNLFAMELAGVEGAKLYAGSWSDWISNDARPVHKGEK